MEAFIVGKFIAETKHGRVWEFIGCFLAKDEAIAACIKDEYFIGPIKIGEAIPDMMIEWPGCYYPRIQVNK